MAADERTGAFHRNARAGAGAGRRLDAAGRSGAPLRADLAGACLGGRGYRLVSRALLARGVVRFAPSGARRRGRPVRGAAVCGAGAARLAATANPRRNAGARRSRRSHAAPARGVVRRPARRPGGRSRHPSALGLHRRRLAEEVQTHPAGFALAAHGPARPARAALRRGAARGSRRPRRRARSATRASPPRSTGAGVPPPSPRRGSTPGSIRRPIRASRRS